MENCELLKKGAALRIAYNTGYSSKKTLKEVDGVFVGFIDKDDCDEKIRILCPIHDSNMYTVDNTIRIDTSDIINIQPTIFPEDVSSLLQIVLELINEQNNIHSQINSLECKSRAISKQLEEKQEEMVQVYAKESQDLKIWKQKINVDLAALNLCEYRVGEKRVYLENLTKDKAIIELYFVRSERVLSKEGFDGETVTENMVKQYAPRRHNAVVQYFPNAKVLKEEKDYQKGDKGYVDFCQRFMLEFDFDLNKYQEWLQLFKSKFACL